MTNTGEINDDSLLSWKKASGIPWSENNCCRNIRICFNCLAYALSQDSGLVQSLGIIWYNCQYMQCITRVIQITKCNASSNQEVCSLENVISLTKTAVQAILCTRQKISTLVQQEVNDLILCMCFIWLSKLPKYLQHHIENLLNLTSNSSQKPLEREILCLILKGRCLLNIEVLFSLCNTKPAFSVYLFAYVLAKEQSMVNIKIFVENVHKGNENAYLYNLAACYFTNEDKPLQGLCYLRKAFTYCPSQHKHLTVLLYNLSISLWRTGKYTACIKTLTSLSSWFQNLPASKLCDQNIESSLLCTLNKDSDTSLCKVTSVQQIIIQMELVEHLLSKLHLVNKDFDIAASMYREVIKCYHGSMNPIVNIRMPSMLQLKAELCLANFENKKSSTNIEYEQDNLKYCVGMYQNILQTNPVESECICCQLNYLQSHNVVLLDLFYCLCLEIYSTHTLPLTNTLKRYSEIIEEVECVKPYQNWPQLYLCEQHNDDREPTNQYLKAAKALSTTKAKILFNYALAISFQDNFQVEQVLYLLQGALQFDKESIIMRWNVVMLLHKIGKKEEGIKTWCKTRGLDTRCRLDKIQKIKHDKEALLETNLLLQKRQLIKKDICILDELIALYYT